jgi:hypothetical protein
LTFPAALIPEPDRDFERFIADYFDSEEAVMIALALREADGRGAALGTGELLERLEHELGVVPTDQRRVAEKRIELRLRDLVTRGLVRLAAEGQYQYAGAEAGLTQQMDRLHVEFTTRRTDLNRLIYATISRARRLAEAFRL